LEGCKVFCCIRWLIENTSYKLEVHSFYVIDIRSLWIKAP
jgi:hypothetical protein